MNFANSTDSGEVPHMMVMDFLDTSLSHPLTSPLTPYHPPLIPSQLSLMHFPDYVVTQTCSNVLHFTPRFLKRYHMSIFEVNGARKQNI